jgi:hypothetical protein
MDILGSPLQLVSQLAASLTDLLGLHFRNALLALSLLTSPLRSALDIATPRGGATLKGPATAAAVHDNAERSSIAYGEWPPPFRKSMRVSCALFESSAHALTRALHGFAQAGHRMTGSLNLCAPSFELCMLC